MNLPRDVRPEFPPGAGLGAACSLVPSAPLAAHRYLLARLPLPEAGRGGIGLNCGGTRANEGCIDRRVISETHLREQEEWVLIFKQTDCCSNDARAPLTDPRLRFSSS